MCIRDRSNGILVLEDWISNNKVSKEANDIAMTCYRAVASSSLAQGSPERDAARSVAHGVFALHFHSSGITAKVQRAIRACITNAERALRDPSHNNGNIGKMRRDN